MKKKGKPKCRRFNKNQFLTTCAATLGQGCAWTEEELIELKQTELKPSISNEIMLSCPHVTFSNPKKRQQQTVEKTIDNMIIVRETVLADDSKVRHLISSTHSILMPAVLPVNTYWNLFWYVYTVHRMLCKHTNRVPNKATNNVTVLIFQHEHDQYTTYCLTVSMQCNRSNSDVESKYTIHNELIT